ncbi:conserved hypothetical protein [Mesorhizobium prunaredense]|uniref:Uncharacterized protein n=1 Tax=Mesorhizobium prunaredense TaxID=1631249 RepID=A0A1R3VDA9_9HYPH|nr:hypothetical protein [Mesorhizobium prunaredense]SIT57842.1 conserved hypothetical protein [Mesorhizobium prunaredense]
MPTRNKRRMRNAASINFGLMLAPSVALMRLPLIAMDARSNRPKGTEAVNAVNEKTIAFVEGIFAAQGSVVQSVMRFWPEVISGRTPSLFNGVALEQSIYAALKPASRRVKTNFGRLSKKA